MTTASSRSHFSPEPGGEPVPHVLRLRTGDIIIAGIVGNPKSAMNEFVAMLHDPVQIYNASNTPRQEILAFKPWLELSDAEEFPIVADMILTLGTCKRDIREQYEAFVKRFKDRQIELAETFERDKALLDLLQTISPNPHVIYTGDEDDYEVFIDDDTDDPEESLHQ